MCNLLKAMRLRDLVAWAGIPHLFDGLTAGSPEYFS